MCGSVCIDEFSDHVAEVRKCLRDRKEPRRVTGVTGTGPVMPPECKVVPDFRRDTRQLLPRLRELC